MKARMKSVMFSKPVHTYESINDEDEAAGNTNWNDVDGDDEEAQASVTKQQQEQQQDQVARDCWEYHHIRWMWRSLFLSVSILLLIIMAAHNHHSRMRESAPSAADAAVTSYGMRSHPFPSTTSLSLTLVGDNALVSHPQMHELSTRVALIAYHQTGMKVDTHFHGNISGLAAIRVAIDDIVAQDQPDIVVVLSQGDIVSSYQDLNESDLEEITLRTAGYSLSLESLVSHMNATYPNVKLACGGPGLVGEGPFLRPQWASCDSCRRLIANRLHEYQGIQMAIKKKYPALAVIDLHQALVDAVPGWWRATGLFGGWVTHSDDGQTLNARGTGIEARVLAALVARHWEDVQFSVSSGSAV
jgi:hypothetical protein